MTDNFDPSATGRYPHDTETFDPAAWLARWKQAGGAWAGRNLLLPPEHRRTLQKIIDDLGAAEIHAIAQHLAPEVTE